MATAQKKAKIGATGPVLTVRHDGLKVRWSTGLSQRPESCLYPIYQEGDVTHGCELRRALVRKASMQMILFFGGRAAKKGEMAVGQFAALTGRMPPNRQL
jgi:hypothetical protein